MQLWFWSQISFVGSLISLVYLGAIDARPATPEVFRVRDASPQFVAQQLFAQQLIAQQNEVLTRAEVYKLRNQVELVPYNQSPRSARVSDVLVPQDALRTAAAAIAELLFNEGSIARVDANTVFRFRQGLRRFQLENRISQQPADRRAESHRSFKASMAQANQTVGKSTGPVALKGEQEGPFQIAQAPVLQKETIFVLESGTALLMSPPNSVGTQVETSESRVSIIAPEPVPGASTATGETETGLLIPPERSSAVMVVHDPAQNSTRVFALTDGDIRVFNRSETNSTPLIGGQTVAITNGQLGPVEEFDLATFYRTVPLAEGLGPGQEAFVAQEPARVQITLNAIRVETLAALRRQARANSSFTGTFLRDALSGSDSDFDGQRGRRNEVIIGGERDDGTFQRSPNDDDDSDIVRGSFTPDPTPDNPEPNPVNIRANLDSRTITIDGQMGRSNDAGLSGNDAVGTVRLRNGRVIRIEVFDVGGEAPRPGQEYRGRLIRGGIQPDQ